MEFHSLANIFPLMEGAEFDALVLDIQQHGQREPIWLLDGKILDGRNRYRACEQLGIEPATRLYDGDDALAFVVSLNLNRRHLDTSQRAMIAARIANLGAGRPPKTTEYSAVSQEDAAARLNVSADSLQFAKNVIEHAEDEIVQAVDAGILSVSQASKLADADPEFQRRVVEKLTSGEAGKVTEALRQVRHEDRPQAAAHPSDRYRIIYADPPWEYGNAGLQEYGHASHHYPTMNNEELCSLPVKEWVLDNAVLFLWVTSPFLEDAFPIIKAWGFSYKTSFVWDKVKHNFGHYNSVRHEFLLVCTRGSCTPDASRLYDSVQSIERSDKHSEKPEQFRAIIDALYPVGKRLEMFARSQAVGWDIYGNEPAETL